MAFDTFSDLKTAMQDWSDRADLLGRMTDFVTLADSRIRKDLLRNQIRLREMETRSDVTPSSGAVTLPTDYMAMKSVQVRETAPRRLEYRPMDWLNEAYPAGDTATPSYYGIEGGTLYMFPITVSDIRLVYYAYPAVLSDSNTSNWLLAKYPDIYLFAGLVEVESFSENREAMDHWISMLTAAFDGLKDSGFSDMVTPGTSRAASGYPT